MTSESRKQFEEWAGRYGLRTDTVRKSGRLYDDFETQTAADAWSARDSEVERLREDAERYRWLRANGRCDSKHGVGADIGGRLKAQVSFRYWIDPNALDSAIDLERSLSSQVKESGT